MLNMSLFWLRLSGGGGRQGSSELVTVLIILKWIVLKLFTYILQVSCEFYSHPSVYSGTLKQKYLSSNGSEGIQALDGSEENQSLDGREGKSIAGWKRGEPVTVWKQGRSVRGWKWGKLVTGWKWGKTNHWMEARVTSHWIEVRETSHWMEVRETSHCKPNLNPWHDGQCRWTVGRRHKLGHVRINIDRSYLYISEPIQSCLAVSLI